MTVVGGYPNEKDNRKCPFEQVILLQYGESVWNKEGIFTG